jgi:hypothetical protein
MRLELFDHRPITDGPWGGWPGSAGVPFRGGRRDEGPPMSRPSSHPDHCPAQGCPGLDDCGRRGYAVDLGSWHAFRRLS